MVDWWAASRAESTVDSMVELLVASKATKMAVQMASLMVD
jgi:hypothetical protein